MILFKRKKKKASQGRHPRKVEELAPWMRKHFDVLKVLITQMAASNGKSLEAELPAPNSRERIVCELANSLRQAVTHLTALLMTSSQAETVPSVLPEVVRAMLLTGNAEKFDPAIRSVISEYHNASEEIYRYSRHPELPQQIRDDIVAGFERVRSERMMQICLLNVKPEAVEQGSELDCARHEVAGELSTKDPKQVNTVIEALTPIFTWTNAYGMERIEPARVVAYTKLETPTP